MRQLSHEAPRRVKQPALIWNRPSSAVPAYTAPRADSPALPECDMTDNPRRTIIETIEVTGGQLLDKVRDIFRHGNIRTLRVHAGKDFSLEMPVTVGAIAGGVLALTAPWLAVLGVIAAMVAKVTIEIERDAEDAEPPPAAPAPDDKPGDPPAA